MTPFFLHRTAILFSILFIIITVTLDGKLFAQSLDASGSKELYLPDGIWKVPENNDFSNNESKYSYQRMVSSDDIAIFWSKEYGNTPSTNPDSIKFIPDSLLKEGERFYNYYVNELKFVDKGHSLTDKYKFLIFIIGNEGGTAFGGGVEQKTGVLWAPPSRVQNKPYGALAHELGHSFQYMVRANGSSGLGGSMGEMTSQYMLWQVYPKWMTFENYHLESYLQKTHHAFLHETNQYHTPYVLEYWSNKHGKTFVGKLWRQAKKGEDPVMAYKRLTGISQEKFNNEMFDAARRFITWDLERVKEVASTYANKHTSKFDSVDDGWFRIAKSRTPQNYGYNGIKLNVPESGTDVSLTFKGMAGAKGYRAIKTEKAGWRYGFLAVKENGSRVYGKTNADSNGEIAFQVPDNTQYLWLVVMGAPTEHWVHITDSKDENDEQWPYKIKLTGTSLDDSVIN